MTEVLSPSSPSTLLGALSLSKGCVLNRGRAVRSQHSAVSPESTGISLLHGRPTAIRGSPQY